MIDVHLKVKNQHYLFFLELMRNLNFVELEDSPLTNSQLLDLEKRRNELITHDVEGMSFEKINELLT